MDDGQSAVATQAIAVGDVFCVTAHPYLRWVVVDIQAGSAGAANVVLHSTADAAVQRVIALAVLRNPARFTRVAP